MRSLNKVIGFAALSAGIVLVCLGCSPKGDISAVITCEGSSLRSSGGSNTGVGVLKRLMRICNGFSAIPGIVVAYPFEGTVFPPEIVAPTFRWDDRSADAVLWMAAIAFDSSSTRIYAIAPGRAELPGPLDSACIRDNNRFEEPPERARLHAWTPDSAVWRLIKDKSSGCRAHIDLYGIAMRQGRNRIVSHGNMTFTTSKDPVGAPIFYRDVPLMPVKNPNGVIQPLSADAASLIAWRLRDISKPTAPIVMSHMPTCLNCHTFSHDGRTLGMDMDGPQGDKGAYALVPTAKRILIQQSDVITWNKFNPAKNTFGLFSRVSFDGRYVASGVEEDVHVCNYLDYRFLQTFYPTRSLIAIYDRQTGSIKTLPGADDRRYVQCNAVWSPDGRWVAFLRAKAKDPFNGSVRAAYANDPRETPMRYDLYRVPFNGGKGGVPLPVAGAVNTGKSVSFPAYSPDGKWIVFVEAKNGLLMRPDSRLFIIPSGGGTARELQCNLPVMNSWHSWSPNGKWMVFSSKAFTPFTQMFLTHIDDAGNASPAVLIPHATAANRAVNIPEFVNSAPDGIASIVTPAMDYKIHFDKSKKLLDLGDADSAYAEIMASIALKPDYAESWSTLAFVLAKQGKLTEAMNASLKAVEHDPANDWVHATAGMLLYAVRKFPESIEQFKIALKLNPNNAVTYYYYGLSLSAAKVQEEALAMFDRALALDSTFSDAYNGRGTVLHGMKRVDAAIADFSRAIALEPKSGYLQNRALAYAMNNRFDSALADLNRGIAANPDDGMTFFIRGNVYLQQHALDKALADFEAALECRQPYIQALDHFCDIYESMNNYAGELPGLNAIIRKNPDNALIINRRGIAYMYSGDAANAVKDFDFVIARVPGEASAYFNKALCLEKLGDLGGAVKNYRESMLRGIRQPQQYAYAKRRIDELKR
jgi:tetratricopeptide (TPR) repeat protein